MENRGSSGSGYGKRKHIDCLRTVYERVCSGSASCWLSGEGRPPTLRKVPLEVSDEEYAAILETQPVIYPKVPREKSRLGLRLGLNAMAILGYVIGLISLVRGFGILGLGFYFSLSTLMLGVSALLEDSWTRARKK